MDISQIKNISSVRFLQDKSGFTLIELLTVVAVVFLLSSISLVSVSDIRRQNYVDDKQTDLDEIQIALERFRADRGHYPNDIYESSFADPVYMRDVPTDPTDDDADYQYLATADGSGYCIEERSRRLDGASSIDCTSSSAGDSSDDAGDGGSGGGGETLVADFTANHYQDFAESDDYNLDASNSSDPEGQALSYSWDVIDVYSTDPEYQPLDTEISRRRAARAPRRDVSSGVIRITNEREDTVITAELQLTVTDPDGNTASVVKNLTAQCNPYRAVCTDREEMESR